MKFRKLRERQQNIRRGVSLADCLAALEDHAIQAVQVSTDLSKPGHLLTRSHCGRQGKSDMGPPDDKIIRCPDCVNEWPTP